MTARSDQELLHAAVDGALTDDEAARLRERLAEDAALRAEADRLRQLAGVVDSLGPEDLPESFSDRVMEAVARSHPEPATWRGRVRAWLDQLLGRVPGHLQQERPGEAFVRRNTGWAGGGGIVAKRALWAAAGLAVIIILGVVYFNGTRTVDQDAQGTIGGAERYRGTQPSGVAVTEGDVQKFLQSDVFDRIIKDERVLKLLENKEARALLAETDMTALFQRDAVKAGLAEEGAEAALRRMQLHAALEDAEASAALRARGLYAALADPDALAALRSDKTRSLLADPEVAAALKNANVRAALADEEFLAAALKNNRAKLKENADFEAALRAEKFRMLLADKLFAAALRSRAALKDKNFVSLLGEEGFEAALKNSRFQALLADEEFTAAIRNVRLRALMEDEGFQAALANARFRALMADPDAIAALTRNMAFVELLGSDMNLRRAMQDGAALDAALRNATESPSSEMPTQNPPSLPKPPPTK